MVDNFAIGPELGKVCLIFKFSKEHTKNATEDCCRKHSPAGRKFMTKRVPGLSDLKDDSFLLPEEREKKTAKPKRYDRVR